MTEGIENLVELSFNQMQWEIENKFPLKYVTDTYQSCLDAYQMLQFMRGRRKTNDLMGADPKVKMEGTRRFVRVSRGFRK